MSTFLAEKESQVVQYRSLIIVQRSDLTAIFVIKLGTITKVQALKNAPDTSLNGDVSSEVQGRGSKCL